jgi:hypothetical protein
MISLDYTDSLKKRIQRALKYAFFTDSLRLGWEGYSGVRRRYGISCRTVPQFKERNMINENTPTAFVLRMPVDELQLDTHHNLHQRVMDCFWCAKIETIGDLVQKSERDLMKIGHFGRTALNQVKERLSELNLKLREETIEERIKRMGIKYIIH